MREEMDDMERLINERNEEVKQLQELNNSLQTRQEELDIKLYWQERINNRKEHRNTSVSLCLHSGLNEICI